MKNLRRIILENESYLWRFRYYGHAYQEPAYLLIVPEKDSRAEIRIVFPLTDSNIEKSMLNSGFRASKNNETVIINLNEPKFMAEFIRYLLNNGVDFSTKKRYLFENGETLLKEMGYKL